MTSSSTSKTGGKSKPSGKGGVQHLRTVLDIGDRATLERVFVRAQELKQHREQRRMAPTLSARVIGMLFERPSTRTYASFEAGIALLGGATVVLHGRDTQMSTDDEHGEPLRDAARVLGSYVDALVVRMTTHARCEELARHARVPVINGGSEIDHPCQVITDMFTVYERREDPWRLAWAYVGEATGTANGLACLAALCGLDVRLALPPGDRLDDAVVQRARAGGGRVTVVDDPVAAVEGADVVSTDAWASLDGLSAAAGAKRRAVLERFCVNDALLRHAHEDHTVLHPLPAHRGLEITDDVLEGMHSVAFQQAKNRLAVQQALLEVILDVR